MKKIQKFLPGAMMVIGCMYGSSANAVAISVDLVSEFGTQIFGDSVTMDWASDGSGIAVGQGPFGSVPSLNTPYDFLYQSSFTGVTGGTGVDSTLAMTLLDDPSTNGGRFDTSEWEITAVARFEQEAVSLESVPIDFDPVNPPNPEYTINTLTNILTGAGQYDTFSIYHGPGVVSSYGNPAQLASGTGFDDGIEIYRGNVLSGFSFFTVLSNFPNGGLGSSQIDFLTDPGHANPGYLTASDPKYTIDDFHFQAQTNYPPGNSETDNYHIDGSATYLPDYVAQANDLPLRVDGDSNFSANVIPSPSTIMLVSAGLIGVGFGARRQHKA